MVITCGTSLASLVSVLLLIVLAMFLTGTTLLSLFNAIRKPVKKVGEFTSEKILEYNEKAEQLAAEREERKKNFKADVDLNGKKFKKLMN